MPTPDASAGPTPSRDWPGLLVPPPAHQRWPLLAGLVLLVAGWALYHCPALNTRLFHAVNAFGPDAPAAWSSLSVLGLALSTWIVLSAFGQRHPERVARLLWLIVVGGIVIHVVKHAVRSPRPLAALGDGAVNVVGAALRTQSMPSGHSAMAFAMFALMVLEIVDRRAGSPAWTARRSAVVAASFAWFVLALAIALSRLAVGAHWPADALVGAGLGLAFAGMAPSMWPVAALTRLLMRPLGQRLMAAGLAVSALAIVATPTVLGALGLAQSAFGKSLSTDYPLAEPLQWLLALLAVFGMLRWWRAAAVTAPGGPA